jgi:hypothetical protein
VKGGKCEFAAYSINGSFAQIVNFANPAFQWPQPGNLAAMQQPQAALRTETEDTEISLRHEFTTVVTSKIVQWIV